MGWSVDDEEVGRSKDDEVVVGSRLEEEEEEEEDGIQCKESRQQITPKGSRSPSPTTFKSTTLEYKVATRHKSQNILIHVSFQFKI